MGDHLIVLHSAVRACPGYNRHEAPSMLLDGASIARETEHGRVVTAQLTRRHGTLEEAIDAGVFALGAAGIPKGIRRQARAACEDYFYNRLGLAPGYELGGRRGDRARARADARRDGPGRSRTSSSSSWTATTRSSASCRGNRLEVEDLRRRVEDDCPEALVLPPREVYRVEAITKSDEPESPGWAYFLELWTETGPARLHIEGELEESGERYTATLNDILP